MASGALISKTYVIDDKVTAKINNISDDNRIERRDVISKFIELKIKAFISYSQKCTEGEA